mgnify:CR=1 FL=1
MKEQVPPPEPKPVKRYVLVARLNEEVPAEKRVEPVADLVVTVNDAFKIETITVKFPRPVVAEALKKLIEAMRGGEK